jgi:hypothetical protein
MVRVERAVRIAAPIEVAWEILGDFSAAEIAGGICSRIDVSGSGIGAVRTMHMAPTWGDGYTGGADVYVRERLESYDAAECSMTYRLVDAGPLPFGDYVGSAKLIAAGPGQCIAVMTSAFVAVELDDAAAAALSRGSIDLALANLRSAAERRQSERVDQSACPGSEPRNSMARE